MPILRERWSVPPPISSFTRIPLTASFSWVADDWESCVMDRSGSHFGLDDQQWDRAKIEVREAILEAAYERRMTWYGEVASKVTVVPLDPYSSLMNHLLGAVFEDEHAASRPALTSIVTHKYGDKEPGAGFYDKARSLGYRFKEPYIFWAQQVQDVFKRYGKPSITV